MTRSPAKGDHGHLPRLDDYNATDDFARSIEEAYRVIRQRKANGGKGWEGWE
jgi:hypothetical protein